MSNRKNRGDDTLGWGLDIFSDKKVDLFGVKSNAKKKSAPVVNKIPESGPGKLMAQENVPIQFPANFYPPEHAESMDIRKLVNIPASTVEFEILRFQAQTAQKVVFYKYGVFTDALDASLVEFIPRINGKRILRYHGDPQDNFKINLSVGPNLNDSNLIPCQLFLKPEDVVTWHVTNNDAVVNPMGVRMTGYIDVSLKRGSMAFGG